MVLIESLDSFVEQAEALYKQNPLKSRYVIKYTHCKGKLTLKVTDDRNTVQYKTDQQSDLKKVEQRICSVPIDAEIIGAPNCQMRNFSL